MSDVFNEPKGATPLDPDEAAGLLLPWIEFRGELDEAETKNIGLGAAWARKQDETELLSRDFVCRLHHQMFCNVWAWAGSFRSTEKNIGIDPLQIPVELRKLLDDAAYWRAHETYLPDEIAIRLHHRLTQIHAFPNGNGRHARLMADLFAHRHGGTPFSWGAAGQISTAEARAAYINALRKADADKNMKPLLEFGHS